MDSSRYINTEGVDPGKGEMTAKRALKILEVLDKRYWSEDNETSEEPLTPTNWPFPMDRP